MTTESLTLPTPEPKRKPAVKPSPNKKTKQTPPDVFDPTPSVGNVYEKAYNEVWAKMEPWKKAAIKDDKEKGILDGHLTEEFARDVVKLAEQMEVKS